MAIQLKDNGMTFGGFAGATKGAPPANQNLQSYIENSHELQRTSTIILEVEGQTINANLYFLKRCNVLMEKLEGIDTSKVIPLTDFSLPVYKAFINYLQTDKVELESSKQIELLKMAHAFQMEDLRFKVLELLRFSVNLANVLHHYEVAVQLNDVELGVASLNFIKIWLTDFLQKADVTSVHVSIVGFLWRDLSAIGAFEGLRASAATSTLNIGSYPTLSTGDLRQTTPTSVAFNFGSSAPNTVVPKYFIPSSNVVPASFPFPSQKKSSRK